MDRSQTYNEICSERDYQLRRWGVRQPDGSMVEADQSVGDFLVYMESYLAEAKRVYARKSGKDAALDVLRRMVALGFACFEQHGCPPRLGTLVTNARDGKPA